jgi:AcrR family transcriptional regulator
MAKDPGKATGAQADERGHRRRFAAHREKRAAARAARHGTRPRGRPGGEESRQRILEEAGQLFARDGFHAVSIRAIASRAEVNVAAIAYHFGGKQGLYEGVIDQLIEDTAPIVTPVVARLSAGVADARGDRTALARLAAAFVQHTLTGLLSSDRLRWQHALLVRELTHPSEVFPMLMAERVDPMHDAVAELVAAATDRGAKESETLLLTADVIGQCMIYGIARTLVWARLGWDGYDEARVAEVIRVVTRSVQRALGLPELAAEMPDVTIERGGEPSP